MEFQGFSQAGLSVWGHHGVVATVMRQRVRDVASQKLRDVTIAIAVAAAASVGVMAWVSAATIPGSTNGSGLTGNAATGVDDHPSTSGGQFVQAPPRKAKFGPGVAVSGGSR
jgi:hypothetical protein